MSEETYEYEFERQKLKKYIGTEAYNMLKRYHAIVAGGSITSLFCNREINDIDMYFKSKKDLSDFLYNEMNGRWVIAKTDKAILFTYEKIKIQAIYFRFFETAEDIFNTFDFTVCMGAFDFDTEKFVLHNDFLKHNVSKILKFNSNTAYPIVSALRINKYQKKGYTISKAEYLRIMLTILNSHIDNYEQLKEQIGGMYGENYDNLLEPKDGENFSIEKIIEKMKYLNLDKDYFVLPKHTAIDYWDDFIYEILNEKIKYFEYKNKKYRLIRGELREFDNITDKYEKVNMEDVVKFPLVRYKYVKQCEDGTLRSYWDNNYIWKIGENVPKTPDDGSGNGGLYAVDKENIEYCQNYERDDKVLLELEIFSMDDVRDISGLLSGTCNFNRVFARRIVPQDEVEELIRQNQNEQCPF